MTTGPNTTTEHRWGPPMAGQGRSMICQRCGARHAVAADTPCPGEVLETFTGEVTQHDYNPLEETEE